MSHFHPRVQVGSVCKGAARVAFPPPKVGVTRTEPYWAVLDSLYYPVEVPDTPERVPGSLSYTRRPLIEWAHNAYVAADAIAVLNP